MKITLPIFTVCLILALGLLSQDRYRASAGSEAASIDPAEVAKDVLLEGAPDGNTLVVEALEAMRAHHAVSAQIQFRGELYGFQFQGNGSYQQQGRDRNRRFRMELRIPVGDQVTSHLQVRDSEYLWIYDEFPSEQTLKRIDIRRLARVFQPEEISLSQLFPSVVSTVGGLPELLAVLAENFDFQVINRQTVKGVPLWGLRGEWRPEMLSKMLDEPVVEVTDDVLSRLQQHVPQRLELYLGADDYFPYILEYQRFSSAELGSYRTAGDDAGDYRPLMSIQLYGVELGVLMGPERFEYSPGSLRFQDITDNYIEKLQARKSLSHSPSEVP